MKQYLFFLITIISLFASCQSAGGHLEAASTPSSSNAPWQKQVGDIDQQIQKLTNQKNLHLARATRLQNQGDRLQFNRDTLLDARMAWQQAQIDREIAERLQSEIEILEKKRLQILDAHGIKDYQGPSS